MSTRMRISLLATAAVFVIEAKSKNACVYEISAQVKNPQVVKTIPEPSTTAHLIVSVASVH